MNDEFYISIICEIFNGYSPLQLGDETVYLSHLSLIHQQAIDELYTRHYAHAVKRGVPTEEDALALQKGLGVWTDFDEQKIAATKDELGQLRITQSKLPLQSQRDDIQKQIEEAKLRLLQQETQRLELLGTTAENYAAVRANEEILRSHVFQDANLSISKYTQEEFDELEHEDIKTLSKLRNELNMRFSDIVVQEACLRPFFSLYMSLCEHPQEFYGKPIINLTINQLKLCAFGKMFYNIFQYTDDIPDNIKRDPQKLISFSEAQRNKGKGKPLVKEDSAGSMVFGATKDDIKAIQKESGGILLTDVMKEKGGKMNMNDFMKLSGDA